VAGSAAALEDAGLGLDRVPCVVIGPGASSVTGARVAIDTGIAGIHEPGTGYRMDEVPLPLSPVLESPRPAAGTLGLLLGALRRRAAARSR
jgi:formylmethanofuran dehydrogenase subunit B